MDGGATWNAENSTVTSDITMVKMVDDSTAYFADKQRSVFKNNYYVSSSVRNFAKNTSLTLYPNPASSFLDIDISGIPDPEKCFIAIENILGEPVYSKQYSTNHLDISGLAPGIYLLKFKTPSVMFRYSKFVKL